MDEASKADGWAERRLLIRNRTKKLSVVLTEPISDDYWLLPGDAVELRAPIESVTDDFEIEILSYGVVVYPSEGIRLISAWQNGRELKGGHLRPDVWPSDD